MLVLCEASDSGTPPPLMELNLFLGVPEKLSGEGDGRSTESGVLGESTVAGRSSLMLEMKVI